MSELHGGRFNAFQRMERSVLDSAGQMEMGDVIQHDATLRDPAGKLSLDGGTKSSEGSTSLRKGSIGWCVSGMPDPGDYF